jgi:hypothetical protein
MPHIAVADATSAVSIQPGAIVSKVIYRDGQVNVTVFGLDAGEGAHGAPGLERRHRPGPRGPAAVHRRRRGARCRTGVLASHGARNAARAGRSGAGHYAPHPGPALTGAAARRRWRSRTHNFRWRSQYQTTGLRPKERHSSAL